MRWSRWAGLLMCLPMLLHSGVKRDESLFFLPTAAWPSQVAGEWEADIRGWIFEWESRRLTLGALHSALGLGGVEMSELERTTFRERTRLFLVDRERRKNVVVMLRGREFTLAPSGADGGVRGRLRFEQASAAAGGRERLQVKLPRRDSRKLTGEVFFVGWDGVSVVSDIDDTIKVSEVRNRGALLRNTFLRPFVVVGGMPEVYRAWAGQAGVSVHYLSASPWPLAPPLWDFLKTNGFPEGPMHLRDFQWSPDGVGELFASPEGHKEAVLEALMERWPGRRFILVGDSGEKDPEVYAGAARRHPGRVTGIGIRDVTGETAASARYLETFRGLARERWVVFGDPAELAAAAEAWFRPQAY